MEVAKTFERNGVRYRPGDALPPDLDKDVLAHYQRHGMVREARAPAPANTKPAAPARRASQPKPKNAEQPAATENKAASAYISSTSDTKESEIEQQHAQAATNDVAGEAATAGEAAGTDQG